jgi:hypothetical protein
MGEAAAATRSAEITTAVKDSKGKAGKITAGQVIGIVDHEIEVIGSDVSDVATEVLGVIADGGDTVTVLAGEDLDDAALDALVERLAGLYPDLEVEGHRGEQPVYPVIIAVE